jgi:hypothetical protein
VAFQIPFSYAKFSMFSLWIL